MEDQASKTDIREDSSIKLNVELYDRSDTPSVFSKYSFAFDRILKIYVGFIKVATIRHKIIAIIFFLFFDTNNKLANPAIQNNTKIEPFWYAPLNKIENKNERIRFFILLFCMYLIAKYSIKIGNTKTNMSVSKYPSLILEMSPILEEAKKDASNANVFLKKRLDNRYAPIPKKPANIGGIKNNMSLALDMPTNFIGIANK